MLDAIDKADRRNYIGGSDAKIIMGDDKAALLQLWKQKRGEAESEDFSRNLVVQLGNATEKLNELWFQYEHPNLSLACQQTSIRHDKFPFIGCTLDGIVASNTDDVAVFEAKFMLPWSFDEDAAQQKHYWQLQHNMAVAKARKAYLSIITGGGKYCCIEVAASAADQALLLDAERKFWFCVKDRCEPVLINAPPPSIAPAAVKIVNMTKSNTWAMAAGDWLETVGAYDLHAAADKLLKQTMPADAKEARGHGVRARRSKSNAVTITEYQEEELVEP